MNSSAAIHMEDLAFALTDLNVSTTILVPSPDLSAPLHIFKQDNITIIRLKTSNFKSTNLFKRTLFEFVMPYQMIKTLISRKILPNHCDGIAWYSPSIFFFPLIFFLKRKYKTSSYLILRDIFPQWAFDLGVINSKLIFYTLKFLSLFQFFIADKIGIQSQGNFQFLPQFIRIKKEIEVFDNWFTPRIILSNNFKELSKNTNLIVYTGNMGIAQGLEYVATTIHKILEKNSVACTFLFIGKGSYKSKLQNFFKNQNYNNVIFSDEVNPNDIPSLLSFSKFGIVALDHRHRTHNIPGKFITYMMYKTPVIVFTTLNSDLANLVLQENLGIVIDPTLETNIEDILNFLSLPINNPSKYEELRTNCHNLYSKRFRSKTAAEKLIHFFSKT
ncbi:glycosyltransferase family 4 protein [Leeia sp. TBRC 13508]|uniref:Glycosyltransferase family 4 protein n=1 Tax=Leeia speluncae TaxID=2884804 RepID=A0ABS8D3P8_9NEIS|nr:glycosyltransferase family 4 protein [Leeia speluncae]MCB6182794.1 glycosyltransferase family 4 protein [Leeia speluncae]